MQLRKNMVFTNILQNVLGKSSSYFLFVHTFSIEAQFIRALVNCTPPQPIIHVVPLQYVCQAVNLECCTYFYSES